ncbi:MAG: hypothetical protein EOP83_24780 [Verrucomicrobiaceae bacterium]|nr:MAG: hypothetical protein EOP83_24780 [Verrucomicrobiaceae bacterium]
MDAKARFARLCGRLAIVDDVSENVWTDLYSRYSESHRHYHNLHHIEAMLVKMDEVSAGDVAMELAIWFHDVIYDPRARDNEEQSAAFFVTRMGPYLDAMLCCEVLRLILATDYARPGTGMVDENLIRDIDLSILASSPEDYTSYAAAVRKEYAHVTDEDFRKGRMALLKRFLEAPIYQSASFGSMEKQARNNIQAEIDSLAG